MGMPGGSPMGPGVPGAPGVPGDYAIEPPKGAVDAALSNGARFLGCINGQQKFVKRSGERVAFTAKEIRDAVSAGVAPACRYFENCGGIPNEDCFGTRFQGVRHSTPLNSSH